MQLTCPSPVSLSILPCLFFRVSKTDDPHPRSKFLRDQRRRSANLTFSTPQDELWEAPVYVCRTLSALDLGRRQCRRCGCTLLTARRKVEAHYVLEAFEFYFAQTPKRSTTWLSQLCS